MTVLAPATTRLYCPACGYTRPPAAEQVCLDCFGPLEIQHDLPEITRADIESGPNTLWRYAPLLPVGHDPADRVDLGVGGTRLLPAPRLGNELGLTNLYVKDESGNPTHSFKDRVVAMAATAAKTFGLEVLACASTGNLANAVAAAAAHAGMRSVVLIPADLEPAKILTTAVYGGTLVAVNGSYDDVNRLCQELSGEFPWGFANVNLRPFYAEGSKTVGYEIAEQLGWRLPEQVVIPVASGSLLTKVDKAFRELIALGLVADTPYRIFGAQADGCSPVATAYATGEDDIIPVRPSTIAKSLAIGNPADGAPAVAVARRTGGAVASVPDPEIIDAIRLLARTEGVFAETAGGVTVGVARRLAAGGLLDPNAETVLLNTGDGLKTLDALGEHVGPTATIAANLDAFLDANLA